ncbi:MAG TPA: bifunctional diaminohydroxyphosphoribosylaminopyrimidine deaminase/5-amino-6-(5-phosphoribosylamino)uracil reductase RibD [Ilumatobacteraceae bacterium]|nr:bifunctional diaminohydroxyphosphoribosylaminopyrimidine deaminase/5-amino-6-(5-phosphoribosylamino)uracil reductase RibD [Ilumatobacteraceae bacterium]
MVIDDTTAMRAALAAAATVRTTTSPNPWVGAVVVTADGIVGVGATEPPGGRHAEIVALAEAGAAARGATVVCTLEPCSHHGRTPPCTDALIAAGVRRVVVGVVDPDDRVAGAGIAALRAAGIAVDVGVLADEITRQLAAYLHHRRTSRPYVVCKLAMSLDGGTAAPDGSSQWITGDEARRDAHRLRAESDAIAVGAGTVRADDPALTVRHVEGADPLRVVLGSAPADARVHPCLQWHGDLDELLDDLGRRGVVQLMVEGGARVIGSFHRAGLVDRYVLYVAPALFGGRDAAPAIGGETATTITDIWRGRFESVERVGADLRIEIVPHEERT